MQFVELKKLPEMERLKCNVTLPSGSEITLKVTITPKRFRDNNTKKPRVVKSCVIDLLGTPGEGEELFGLGHVFDNLEAICERIKSSEFQNCEERFDLEINPLDGSKGHFRSNTHIGIEGVLTDFESAKAALLKKYPDLGQSVLDKEQLPKVDDQVGLTRVALCLANQVGDAGLEHYKEFKNEPDFLPVNLVKAIWEKIKSEIPEDKAIKPDNKTILESLLNRDSPYSFCDFMVSFAQIRRMFRIGFMDSPTVTALEDMLLAETSEIGRFAEAFIPIRNVIKTDFDDACEVWKRLKENSSEKTVLELMEIVTRILNDERRSNGVIYSLKGSLVDNPVSLREEMPKRLFDGWAHPLLWLGCVAAKSDSSFLEAFKGLVHACKDTTLKAKAMIAEDTLQDPKKKPL